MRLSLGAMSEMFRFSSPAAGVIRLAVACCVILTACERLESQARGLDIRDGRGVTVFFILGFLDEYLGRNIVQGDDLVERFYCDEAAKVVVFRRQLERLAREQGLDTNIRQETLQRCLTMVRSSVLADALNALYRKRQAYSIKERSMTDTAGRRRGLTTVWVDDQLFLGAERELKFAYVAGAYARYGAGDSLRLANSQHKVAVLVALLKELGCSNIRTDSIQGRIPQTMTIYFQPSEEMRSWFDRGW
jgi:hypothetical protein